MLRYLGFRLLAMVVAIIGVSTIVFALVHLIPGDPVRNSLGTRFNQELYDRKRAEAGLDRPLVEQYLRWMGHAVRGDLGESFRSNRPVTSVVLERLPATLSLAFAALFVALLIALPVGLLSAVRSGSKLDYTATAASQVGVSVPDFWAAIMYILLFSITLAWLPPSGYVSPFEDPKEWARHLVLPAITVGLVSGSILTRFVRSAVLEAYNQDYVRTAVAKGLGTWQVVWGHVVPNAAIPIVTVVGLQLGLPPRRRRRGGDDLRLARRRPAGAHRRGGPRLHGAAGRRAVPGDHLPRHQPDRRRALRRARPTGPGAMTEVVNIPPDPDTFEGGAITTPLRSRRAEVWSALVANRLAVLGLVVLGLLVLAAIFGPTLAPYGANEQEILNRFAAPSRDHWFGTDDLGRDVFSRVLIASRASLQVGIIAVGIAVVLGLPIGLVAGFYGRATDGVLMRLMDMLFAFPAILLAIAIVAVRGPG